MIPSGVRIANADRVRLGAHLASDIGGGASIMGTLSKPRSRRFKYYR